MNIEQERKYDAVDGKIVNRSTGKPIPDDEPIIIFRAKDRNAIAVLEHYKQLCTDETHRAVIEWRINDFSAFQASHPEAMKEPDSDEAELLDIAKKAAEAQRNDTRTDDEKIADGVAFILDTRIGGT